MVSERTLTTREVAARLGVKPATVYAYVSRGLLRSVRGTGGRGSTFAADDVEALVARGGDPRPRTGVAETVATRLTLLEHDELSHRGHPVRELVDRDLAAVAGLLWSGSLDDPPALVADPDAVAVARTVLAGLPPQARLTDRLRVAAAAVAPTDPWRFDLDPDAVRTAGARLVRGLVDAIAPEPDPHAGLATTLWPALTGAPPQPVLLERALVLLADHGLAASTLTARVAASARAHVYAVVTAGLGALDGPAHGTASTAAHRFLAEAFDDPAAAVTERLRAGGTVPGFGHLVYRRRDPRAELLLADLAGTAAADLVDELVGRLDGRPGMFPNVDLALAAMMHAHAMRPDAGEAVFAVARSVGWIAHALEEYAEPGLRFRVEGTYVGARPRR